MTKRKKIVLALFLSIFAIAVVELTVCLDTVTTAFATTMSEMESNNTAATANVINVNTEITGNIATKSDVDWYKFTTSSNGYISVSFNHTLLSNDYHYWNLSIYDSTAVTSLSGTRSVYGKSNLSTCNYGIPAGTYYIKIEGDVYSSSEDYTVKVNFTADSNWETEFNDSSDIANNLKLNTEMYGTIKTSSDKDWYKFTTSSNGYISVSFNHTLLSNDYHYWNLSIYDSTAVTSLSGTRSVYGKSNLSTCNYGIPAGTYYIKIEGDVYSSSEDYTVKVNFTADSNWETELNNSKDVADAIPFNTAMNGVLCQSSDVDWYTFTAKSNMDIKLTFEHEQISSSYSYWCMDLYDSSAVTHIDGTSEFSICGNANKTTDTYTIPNGVYYIRIKKGNNYYSSNEYSLMIEMIHDCNFSSYTKLNDTSHQKTCTICEKVVTESHTWQDYRTITSATCKDTGLKEQHCTLCDASREVTIPTTNNHVWGATEQYNENQHKHTCTVCNKEEYLSHTWDGGSITLQPTCTTNGTRLYTCTACTQTKTEAIAAQHAWGNYQQYTETEHKRVCSVCHEEEYFSHSWNSGEIIKEANCVENGIKLYTCTVCYGTKQNTINKTGVHAWGEWISVDDTNHKHICTVCDEEVVLEHDFGEWQIVDEESHRKECVCGKTITVKHTYTAWEQTIEATTKTDGEKQRECEVCGYHQTEVVPRKLTIIEFVQKYWRVGLIIIGVIIVLRIVVKCVRAAHRKK